MARVKLQLTVEEDIKEEFEKKAKKMGVTKSAYFSMLAYADSLASQSVDVAFNLADKNGKKLGE